MSVDLVDFEASKNVAGPLRIHTSNRTQSWWLGKEPYHHITHPFRNG